MPRPACGEEASRLGCGALALRGGPVDVLGLDPEDTRDGPNYLAEDGGPEMGDPFPLRRSP